METRESMSVTHYEGPATLTPRDQRGQCNVHATVRIWREYSPDPDDPHGLYPYAKQRWAVDIDGGEFPPPYGECTITCPGLGDGLTVVNEVAVRSGESGWQGTLTGYGPAPGLA